MPRPKQTLPPPTSAPADGEVVGRSCPICQAQIVRGEQALACPACKLDYHEECWRDNGGCGAYGCARAPEAKKKTTADTSEEPEIHWAGEKRCPGCREQIKAQALVCPRCKARFWTREPISREAWDRREYDGDELTRVRNVLILTFLFSACGCLFPITGLVTGLWVLADKGPYSVARLPPALAVLLKASFGASIVWAFVFIVTVVGGSL